MIFRVLRQLYMGRTVSEDGLDTQPNWIVIGPGTSTTFHTGMLTSM